MQKNFFVLALIWFFPLFLILTNICYTQIDTNEAQSKRKARKENNLEVNVSTPSFKQAKQEAKARIKEAELRAKQKISEAKAISKERIAVAREKAKLEVQKAREKANKELQKVIEQEKKKLEKIKKEVYNEVEKVRKEEMKKLEKLISKSDTTNKTKKRKQRIRVE